MLPDEGLSFNFSHPHTGFRKEMRSLGDTAFERVSKGTHSTVQWDAFVKSIEEDVRVSGRARAGESTSTCYHALHALISQGVVIVFVKSI